MKLHHQLSKENGYLLLESLVNLIVISGILIIIYPVIINWQVIQKTESDKVELSRVLYEQSIEWPKGSFDVRGYNVRKTDTQLTVSSKKQHIGIEIYEVFFEE